MSLYIYGYWVIYYKFLTMLSEMVPPNIINNLLHSSFLSII